MQNKTTNKPEGTISLSNLPSIIVAVCLIVSVGTIYGLIGYLIFGIKENVTPIIQKPIQKPFIKITNGYFGNEFIQIKTPQKNAVIKNPVLISGKANVDEANVRIRIMDDNKNILADTFITSGGWMDKLYSFKKEINYEMPQTENGLIEIFEESMKDGSDLYKVEVPVVFEEYEKVSELSCVDIAQEGTQCEIDNNNIFELVKSYSYADKEGCKPVMGGCFLNDISYDKEYIQKLDSVKTERGKCMIEEAYLFKAIKKGETEIITAGTCDFDKIYKIIIK